MAFGKAFGVFAVMLAVIWTSGAVAQDLPEIVLEEESQITSDDFSLFYVEREQTSSLVGFVVENEPPLVNNVEISPAAPGVGEDITVEATIENDPKRTTNKPIEAKLIYSANDGATWRELEMEQVDGTESLWRAVIPALGAPADVRYFFTALDDAGNALLELPTVSEESMKLEDFAATVGDDDESEGVVKDDLDILGAKVWDDGSRLHFALKVAGKISGGTITPFDANIYSVGIYYPQRLPKRTEGTDLLLVYAENAPFIQLPKVVLLDSDKDFNQIPSAEAEFRIDDGWLFLSIKEQAIEGGRFDSLRVVLGTSYATGFSRMFPGMGLGSLFNIVPTDTTPFMNIVRADRSFAVGGE